LVICSTVSVLDEKEEEAARPTLAAYAAERGLFDRGSSFALPQATQLLRHGFMREVPSLVRGDLPGGLTGAWLAQVAYVYSGVNELKRRHFTLVLVEAPASLGFAVRVLCHDRGLTELDMTNPDSERELIQLDDRAVRLESEGFLRRYALFTDHDQDEVSAWRLFAPSLIDWLTDQAPAGFSFELQDGALCCFVPGSLAAPAELDGLCEAAARVLKEVSRIGPGAGSPTKPDSRRARVDEEIAEQRFDQPPKNVKAAAKAFRNGLLIGDESWKLGAEAFFREQMAAVGWQRLEPSEFRASHIETFLPGVIAQVAKGRLRGTEAEVFLVLTNSEDFDGMGWSVLVADLQRGPPGLDAAGLPRGVSSDRGVLKASTDGRSLFLSSLDGGARERNATELGAFLEACAALVR
jgi:hypothetical protein